MNKPHRFQPRKNNEQEQNSWIPAELPLDETVAVYARRSTAIAVTKTNTSNEMQTTDLVAFARRLGWNDDKIIVFAQDMGRSGRLRIDEREGLLALISDIEAGIIKAIVVYQEDRLFRDETQIQVNVFIDICRKHQVLVITPHMTYDFTNRFHVKQFRWRMEAAADFLRDYVMARLVAGKNRVGERGEYVGGGIPPGYIVDRRETITVHGEEVKNPTYKKYLMYEPHAIIVILLFERFLMLAGNLTQLCNELKAMPFVFPDFTTDFDQRNLAMLQLRRVPGGYHLTKRGLISILTNVAYLGWWFYQGKVTSKQNHPAIMEGKEEMFWYAFNKLSPFLPDGTPNPEIRKKQPPRYQQNGTTDSQALLKNIITTELLGPVYVVPCNPRPTWLYALHEKDLSLSVDYHVAMKVRDVDRIFVDKLLAHLHTTSDFTHYRQYVTKIKNDLAREQASITQQIAKIDERCEGIFTTLQLPPEKLKQKAREKLATKYEELLQQRDKLEKKLNAPERTKRAKTLLAYYDLIEKVAQYWPKYPFEDRKTLVEALAEQVVIDIMAPHWMRLIIRWRIPHWGEDVGLIWRVNGSARSWTEKENTILWEQYGSATRAELLALLPTRSWRAINYQAHLLGIHRSTQMGNNSPIPPTITYIDWQFMQEQKIMYNKVWKPVDVLWLESEQVAGIRSFWDQFSE